jgi:transposase
MWNMRMNEREPMTETTEPKRKRGRPRVHPVCTEKKPRGRPRKAVMVNECTGWEKPPERDDNKWKRAECDKCGSQFLNVVYLANGVRYQCNACGMIDLEAAQPEKACQ